MIKTILNLTITPQIKESHHKKDNKTTMAMYPEVLGIISKV